MIDGARIRVLRKEKGLIQQELADLIGVAKTTIVDWEKGRYCPEWRNLLKLAKALEIDASILLSATDNTSLPSPAENSFKQDQAQKPADDFHRIGTDVSLNRSNTPKNVRQQSFFERVHQGKKQAQMFNADDPEPIKYPQIFLPVINQEACAGFGFNYDDGGFEEVAIDWIPFPILHLGGPTGPHKPHGVVVSGDSMTGARIYDGNIAIINPNVEPSNGNIIYVKWRGKCSIKGFIDYGDKIELRPANPNYQSLWINEEDYEDIQILGKVVRVIDSRPPRDII